MNLDRLTTVLIAVVREVSPRVGECELTHHPRVSIDFARAAEQHRAYVGLLESLGCRVAWVPSEPDLPDSVFVEDAAVVLDEVAVVTRPGAPSRRGETSSVAAILAGYREVATLEAPATLDGGDVLRIGRDLYVGLSSRSNRAGIEGLASVAGRFGYRVHGVPVTGCLHLKSAATLVGPRRVLINPRWVDGARFTNVELVTVRAEEPGGANALLVGHTVIYPASHPLTAARLEKNGTSVRTIDVSEIEKAEGGVTCCSVLVEVPGAGT